MTHRFSVTISALSNGRTISAAFTEETVNPEGEVLASRPYEVAMSSDLLYERITEVTNQTVRRLVNKLEPEVQRLRRMAKERDENSAR
jgi:transposase-like protein